MQFHKPFLQVGLAQLALAVIVCSLGVLWFRAPSQGLPVKTDRQLDVAIFGRGYFQIQNVDSSNCYYTRYGKLSINRDGQLMVGRAKDGWLLQPPITLPSNWSKLNISPTGSFSIETGDSASETVEIGSIQLATFLNEEGLTEVLPEIFAESDSSGLNTLGNPGFNGLGLLQQGWLESPESGWTLSHASILLLLLLCIFGIGLVEIRKVQKRLDEMSRSLSSMRQVDAEQRHQ